MQAWDLEPGERIKRAELHRRYGGRGQGGIGPSAQSPNVFIFSDPDSGAQHGYFDSWVGDEFHYAGEGQRGDQTLDQGNGAILKHRSQGRALRVFWGSKGVVEYAGEFELDTESPYHWVDAPESGGGPLRKVVMFHLLPKGELTTLDLERPKKRTVQPLLATAYRDVDPSQSAEPRDPFEVDPNAIDRGLRGHAQTQQMLAELAITHGLEPLSPGPADPNFDLAWRDADQVVVVEVKSLTDTNESGQIRLGLGQVLDYQHILQRSGSHVRAILAVEREPSESRWSALCSAHDVTLVWPSHFDDLFASPSSRGLT